MKTPADRYLETIARAASYVPADPCFVRAVSATVETLEIPRDLRGRWVWFGTTSPDPVLVRWGEPGVTVSGDVSPVSSGRVAAIRTAPLLIVPPNGLVARRLPETAQALAHLTLGSPASGLLVWGRAEPGHELVGAP